MLASVVAATCRCATRPRHASLAAAWALPWASRGPRAAASTARPPLPSQARVVVCGGGIVGSSIAYHLAKFGWTDVLLLERDQVTSGTTWHAAGLMVTFGSLSETSTEMRKYTKELYSRVLEEETGLSTGFMPVGFIELATDAGYLEEYRRVAAFNRKCGVEVHEISPREVKELFPLCRTDDVLAGFYVKDDGRVNPVDATAAFVRGAKNRGVTVVEGVSVRGVKTAGGRVTGVQTTAGDVDCEVFVNAAGMWARQLGQLSGVTIANQAAEHYYLLTEAMPDVDPSWPVVEDPSRHTYIRPEGGGLMVGLFEPEAAAWSVPSVPGDFSFGEIEPDWDRMAPFLETAMGRVPRCLEVGAKKLFCGPESFTPDLSPIVGEAPELKKYFIAAGMNSIGILTGGGIGRSLARTIVDGHADVDVTAMLPDRLQAFHATPSYRGARVVESLGKVYKCHYPNRRVKTARNVKRSPLHERLVARGAYFRDVSGWECADYYADLIAGERPEAGALTWGRPVWFERWATEHRACREGVVLIDMSFMSKFFVQGRDVGQVLDRLVTSSVGSVPAGLITYTQMLSEHGTLEADVTVTKLPEGAGGASGGYMVVATDTAHRRVESLLKRGIQRELPDAHAFVTDVTGAYAQINLQGPRSRALLAAVTSADVSDAAFPFRGARTIDIGCAPVLATRITYVGELGYELFVPAEFALHVYDAIVSQASAGMHELAHAGLKALASLRMEKGYRDFGHDMDNLDTLLEAGLGFTADFEKSGGFVGREAVLAQKQAGGPARRLVQVRLRDPEPLMYHGEVIYRDGDIVGDIRAASYGHTLGGAVGLAMVQRPSGAADARAPLPANWVSSGTWEVDVAGKRYPAVASLRPMFDPRNDKIKG